MNKIKVAILGATGSVGQKFIELLSNHPWFEIAELAASERSAGKRYFESVNWLMHVPLDESVGNKIVKECKPDLESRLVFSALDSSVAGKIETEFAKAGYFVISNARNHRFDDDVPLIIPEINPDHLNLIKSQKFENGFIVTNPNCSTIGMAISLKPLHDNFGLETVSVATMQAVSGAGYPGLSSLDISDNVIPFISGEEEKMETEPLKIFGNFNNENILYADFKISAQCNRVSVIDGHTEAVQVKLKRKTSEEEIIKVWNNFVSEPQKLELPSAPKKPIWYLTAPSHPQPKLHRSLEGGMAVSIGRLRKDPLFDFKFVVLSHNTVRGAAGGTILIAELMKAKNMLSEI